MLYSVTATMLDYITQTFSLKIHAELADLKSTLNSHNQYNIIPLTVIHGITSKWNYNDNPYMNYA